MTIHPVPEAATAPGTAPRPGRDQRIPPAGPQRPGVLIVGNFLSATSNNRQVCEDLAEVLQAHGWPVVTTSSKTPRATRLLDMVSTTWRRRHDYSVAQLDVFSGPSFLWAEAVCEILHNLGKPFVLTLHGGTLPEFAARSPRRVRRLLGRAAVVTTPSRYLLQQMSPYRRELLQIPNPVDVASYPWRIRENPRPRLVWLRSFHHIYNPELAVRVIARLARSFDDATLTMIGGDKGDGALQQVRRVAHELGVADRLTFTGGIEKSRVPCSLAEHDIFINTTNADNTPVSVIEAMACGLCVVSTEVGGIPYMLAHETDALLVPPDDPASMTAAVERILSEDGLAERLSRNARSQARTYDWSYVLPAWERLLSGLAGYGR